MKSPLLFILVFLLFVLLTLAPCSNAAVPAQGLSTFSAAIKGNSICPCRACSSPHNCTGCTGLFNSSKHGCPVTKNFQAVLYEGRVPPPQSQRLKNPKTATADQIGVVRLMWFTGTLLWPNFGNTTIRVYVDEEADAFDQTSSSYSSSKSKSNKNPAITFKLYEAHALGNFGWTQGEKKTWGTRQFGKGSLFGGLYMGFQIPFSKRVTVTAELPSVDIELGLSYGLYFIIRGLYGLPHVTVGQGQFALPPTARLKLHRHENVVAAPHSVQSLAHVGSSSNSNGSTTTGGMIYLVTLLASSGTPHFLEGEFKAQIDDQPEPITLSSGTEDYFLSAQYFDAGEFQFPNSGATHVSLGCLDEISPCRVAAYRFHDELDPIFFSTGINLTWNVGDAFWKVEPVNMTSLVWIYEW